MPHLIALADWNPAELNAVLDLADRVKARPADFADAMCRRMLVMIFEKPSLRTRISFETGMCRMGGDAIYYDMSTSPLGAGKETIEDTARVLSRYADLLMARLFRHEDLLRLAATATVPVINGLTNFNHPCQILADFQTIREYKGRLAGLTLAYLGDACNNVTHSLMSGCALMGMTLHIGCPSDPAYQPLPEARERVASLCAIHGSRMLICDNALEAAQHADIIYTDSWMSYHIPKDRMEQRARILEPFQVNARVMAVARPDAIFMNCLPAMRGYEQTAEVIDGPQAVVFDQAENRLHAQKAVMLRLLGLDNPSSKPPA